MFGFFVFERLLVNVGEKCCNKLLGNIFGIVDVIVSDVILEEGEISFRIFSKGIFYNYMFVIGSGDNWIERDERIVNYRIFIGNKRDDNIYFNEFIWHLSQCCDEYQVYQLVRQLL